MRPPASCCDHSKEPSLANSSYTEAYPNALLTQQEAGGLAGLEQQGDGQA